MLQPDKATRLVIGLDGNKCVTFHSGYTPHPRNGVQTPNSAVGNRVRAEVSVIYALHMDDTCENALKAARADKSGTTQSS